LQDKERDCDRVGRMGASRFLSEQEDMTGEDYGGAGGRANY